ncbi:metallophosphoesterase [Aurantibacter crassamenti]|uniref:metallophosphoesterase n=1 Tax=Aurantibacter crassamenti TaxID=1837375 RepID=UPI00193ADD36|nr:metallophosphoesterase [Aurantibacter crassamenti]MBM1104762.1 metallophosphoesterase [Aurantibacter crassamenti]
MKKYNLLILSILFFSSCATQKTKYAFPDKAQMQLDADSPIHTFYLIGDAGKSPEGKLNAALTLFKKQLSNADENSTAIFLGDNVYPAGLPSEKHKNYTDAKNSLDAQLKTLDGFKGQSFFIPGNHDWYAGGLDGLKRQQEYIQEALDSKDVFFPEDGCPIEKIDINDDVVVIAIDTEWYLTNWDKHPDMNDKCDIKDREKFFEEIEGLIKKNANKTTLIAAHHPMSTYGVHGGQYSLKQQLYPSKSSIPLPIIGSVINFLRKTTGTSHQDLSNKRYNELRKRLVTLAQYSEKVIFVSGHEHSLQYIIEDNTPQIVSGAGAKNAATGLLNGSQFSTGEMGYAKLEVYKDGSSNVFFFGVDDNEQEENLFATQVLKADKNIAKNTYAKDFPLVVKSSIYPKEATDKSGLFKWFWGDRYREIYSKEISAPTVDLDTLFGGLKVMRKGGGHQSRSLRMVNPEGKEYVMRALKKSAEVYLQAMAFKDQYVVGDFEDTYTESLLEDFYTGSHPYAPFTIGKLSDAVGIYHTNPVLYYVPKQNAIGNYNDEFGDELYMIEERTDSGHGDQKSFGYSNTLISTDDLLKKLRKDEDYQVDKTAYVRARLFDMMIGDWDRHTDQWRWAEFEDEKNGKVIYKPIPRDRDQAYSEMGDGFFMNLATRAIPGLTLMEGFNEEIRSVRGFNGSPKAFALDMLLLPETEVQLWETQTEFIQKNITNEVIDIAFKEFPKEIQDEKLDVLKKKLLARKKNLLETAREYYGIINKYSVVAGTDKDDHFIITGKPNGDTEVVAHRIKKGKKGEQFYKKTYNSNSTKEIWIYGLDDDDRFDVTGVKSAHSKVRIIGGHNNDIYNILDSKGVHIYDQKVKKNTFENKEGAKIRLSNDYETNTYQPIKVKKSSNQIVPTIGSNPDDGFRIGISDVYTKNGFKQNPFTSQHTFNAAFFFATQGFDFGYKGEFARLFGTANFEIDSRMTSSNFSINFFGYGNETVNLDDALEFDYNRVKMEIIRLSPSLVWRGEYGSKFRTGISYESIEVEETEDRFVNTFYVANGEDNQKDFIGVEGEYDYANTDNAAFPTVGMSTSLLVGYKSSTGTESQNFGYIVPSLSIDHKLTSNGRLVLATKWKAHFNIGDGFEFYQGASLGGVDGLRGFRNQRFTGKTAYYQNSDIRYSLRKMKTGIMPLTMGLYGGFDYGRVWIKNQDSNQWHTSYGGGFFLNTADILSLTFAVFNSDDGARFTFGLGFGF